MADGIFNAALGRVGEFYNRVKINDPANSALVIVVLKSAGLESDATLRDYDDLAAILAASSDEATNSGYARKVLTDVDLTAFAPDDSIDRVDLDLPDQTFGSGTGVGATGGAWAKLLVCYDPNTTSGGDDTIIPLAHYDFVTTPDGSEIVALVNTAGFFRARQSS